MREMQEKLTPFDKKEEIEPAQKITEKITEEQRKKTSVLPVKTEITHLNQRQKETAFIVSKKMLELPGVKETCPQITNVLEEIIKTKGEAVLSVKATLKNTIYSLETIMKDNLVVLTISINDKDNSTTILLTDKNGGEKEGFYNKPKQI